MKFLKNHGNAFIIACVVVVACTVLGTNRSAKAEARKVLDEFSASDSSIQSQLDTRAAAAMSMYSIYSERYRGADAELDSAAQALRTDRAALTQLISQRAGAGALFTANETLQSRGEDFFSALSNLDGLSENDSNLLNGDYNRFSNAQRAIGDSKYNQSVHDYNNRVLAHFPLSLFRFSGVPGLAVTAPEPFA